jgi:hypothetical protein
MSKSNSLLYIGAGLLGGFVVDKVFNNGEISDKVVSGGSSVSERIVERVQGGTEILRETITERVIENPLLSNGFDTLKENISGLSLPSLPSLPSVPKLPSLPTTGFLSEFKQNGGVAGATSDLLGLGVFYTGAYNIGTFINEAFTDNEFEVKIINGQATRVPIKKNSKTSAKKSSGSSSSSGAKFISSITKPIKEISSTPSNANFNSISGGASYVAPTKKKDSFLSSIGVNN